MRFHIHWIEHMAIEHYDADDLRNSLDKGTIFKNCGDNYNDGSYEVEFDHYFDADDISDAIEYTKKYLKTSPEMIEVFSLLRDEVILTEENL